MDLNSVRKAIDKIDSQIKPLFIERMSCAKRVAEVKAQNHDEVFVLAREQEIIAQSSVGVNPEIQDEYIEFLRNLFSISRHYQYGLLKDVQQEVIGAALAKSGCKASKNHTMVEIAFTCFSKPDNFTNICNIVALGNIPIKKLESENIADHQQVKMLLEGNIQNAVLRQVITQIAKESSNFEIKGLK